MNIIVYTADYCETNKKNSRDAQYIHNFAHDIKDKGNNVQVVYLNLGDNKETTKRRRIRMLPFIPSCIEYEYEDVSVFKINCIARNKNGHCRIPSVQTRYIQNRIYELKERLQWEIDKIYVHFPTFFVGVDNIVNNEVRSLAIFHPRDIENLKSGEKETENFVKAFGRWGACNSDIHDYLKNEYWRESVLLPGGLSANLIPDSLFINYKITRKRKNLKIVCALDLNDDFKLEWLESFAKKSSAGIELTVLTGEPVNENEENCSDDGNKTKVVAIGDDVLRKKELMEADVLLVDKLYKYEKLQNEAMACGCIPAVLNDDNMFGFYNSNKLLTLPLRNVVALSREDKERIIKVNYIFAKSITRDEMATRYLYANNAYSY